MQPKTFLDSADNEVMTDAELYSIFFGLTGISAGALLAWFIASAIEKKHFGERVEVFEKRTKVAEARVSVLTQQLQNAKENIANLCDKIKNEKNLQASALAELHLTFKQTYFKLAAATLTCGFLIGGAASWAWTSATAETRHLRRVMELEINSRVAEAQSQLMQTDLKELRESYRQLSRLLIEEKEAKAVALAKLEMILESTNGGRRLKGFGTDQRKQLEEWYAAQQENHSQTTSGLVPTPVLL